MQPRCLPKDAQNQIISFRIVMNITKKIKPKVDLLVSFASSVKIGLQGRGKRKW